MDVSAIVSEYGSYYLNHGQNRNSLHKKLYFKSETDELFTRVNTDDTIIRRGSSTITRLLQPFQKTWSPTGTLTVSPKSIPLYGFKMDFEDYPDELVETWIGWLADSNLDRKAWPFVKWLIEVHIIEKMQEDYEVNEVFMGEYAAPGTPGTAGLVSTSMEGLRKLLNDAIDGTDVTAITTGALSATATTFTEQVEAFVRSIDSRYRRHKMTLAMSIDNEVLYRQGMREKYNMYYNQENDLLKVADYPNITVKGFNSWGTSDKLFCSPKENMICGVKKSKNQNMVRVENVDRQIKVYTDFHKGVGWVLDDLIFTNEQDNPV